MNAKLLGTAAFVALSAGLVLGGCSSSSTETSSAPTAPQTSANAGTSEGCTVAEVTGQSKNAELMALATAQYEALDCASDLNPQLLALSQDPALEKQAKAAGLDVTTGEALGAVTMSITDVSNRTACTVTVMDSPKAKSKSCADL